MSNWVTLPNKVRIDLDDPHNPLTGDGKWSDLDNKTKTSPSVDKMLNDIDNDEKVNRMSATRDTISGPSHRPLVDKSANNYDEKVSTKTDEMVKKGFTKQQLLDRGIKKQQLENIRQYTDGGREIFKIKWNTVNKTLNTPGKGLNDLTPPEREWILSIDDAVNKTEIPEDMVVYRGMRMSFDKIKELQLDKNNTVLVNNSLLSTSTSIKTARKFAQPKEDDEYSILSEIEVDKGSKGCLIKDIAHTASAHQNEVLFGLGKKTKTTSVEVDHKNRVIKIKSKLLKE